MKIQVVKKVLYFKNQTKTSRGELKNRPVWFLRLEHNGNIGIGECAPIEGLSSECIDDVENALNAIIKNPQRYINICEDEIALQPTAFTLPSSVLFCLEMAILDLHSHNHGNNHILFASDFTHSQQGIAINGLIWMSDKKTMQAQIADKIEAGFTCIKLKIGGINFEEEFALLQSIRKRYSHEQITLRLDANGNFLLHEAMDKLQHLATLDIHSIEQPIQAGNREQMAYLCASSPIPIALDEELIGIHSTDEKAQLLDTIKPQFLILKPSLHGGFQSCDEWITLAKERNIAYWITSYLESNVGLNAIAQWAFTKNTTIHQGIHQGLGTGEIFTNNIASPLYIDNEKLYFNKNKKFDFSTLFKEM